MEPLPKTQPPGEVWISVAECAAKLNICDRAVRKNASTGKYSQRYVPGHGHGRGGKVLQIALSSLPASAQAAYWSSRPVLLESEPPPDEAPDPAPALTELPEWKLREATRRAELVQEFMTMRSLAPQGSIVDALDLFCTEKGISRGTFYNHLRDWKAAPQHEKLNGLIPKAHKNRGRSLTLTEDMKCLIVSHYCREAQPFAQHTYERLSEYCENTGQYCPSRSTVRRHIASIPPSVICLSRDGADAYIRKYGYFATRDLNGLPVNAWWCIDHRQFDVLVYEDERRERMFRPWLTAIMDLRSRYFVGYHIGPIPNSTSIGLALRNAIAREVDGDLVRGFVPKNLYMDDGKDFRSAHLHGKTWRWQDLGKVEMGQDTRGVLTHLGITPIHALPYHPQSKPIEPNFRWIPYRFERTLPGWTGNSEQNRPAKLDAEIRREALLTMPELIERFPAALAEHHALPHKGIGCTPGEAFNAAGAQVSEIGGKALWLLLMKSKPLTVHRDGIRPLGQKLSFWNDGLGLHVGEKVQCRWDPADVSKVYCFTLSGDFLCLADNIPLSRMGETTEAEFHAAAARRKAARERVKTHLEDRRVAEDITHAVRTAKRKPDPPEPEPLRAVANGDTVRMIGEMDHLAASMQRGGGSRQTLSHSRGDLSLSEILDRAEAMKGDADERS